MFTLKLIKSDLFLNKGPRKSRFPINMTDRHTDGHYKTVKKRRLSRHLPPNWFWHFSL